MDTVKKDGAITRDRRPWEPPVLNAIGTINQVLQGGGGKLTLKGGDPGEARKMMGGSD